MLKHVDSGAFFKNEKSEAIVENTQTTNLHYQWGVHPWHSSHIVLKWYSDDLHPKATTQYHNHYTPKNNISKLQNEPLGALE